MRRLFLFFLLLILIPQLAAAQDTIVTLQGRRLLATDTRIGKFKLHFTGYPDSAEQKLAMRQVYFIRYADGRTWPPAIGSSRQRVYRRNVMQATGDTALALDRLPLRRSAKDTITTFQGAQIIASGTTVTPFGRGITMLQPVPGASFEPGKFTGSDSQKDAYGHRNKARTADACMQGRKQNVLATGSRM